MRKTFFALTAICLAPTAAMASVSGRALVGGSELGATAATVQERHIAPSDRGEIGQRDSLKGKILLAKGDMSGNGPGVGGQKGQKKGGHKGKQSEGKDNPNKAKGKDKS